MQFQAVLAMTLIHFVLGFGTGEEKFIKKYAMMKVYESCFGTKALKEIRNEMKNAAFKCSGTQTNFEDKHTEEKVINRIPSTDWPQEPSQKIKFNLGNKLKKPIHTADTLLLQQWAEEQKEANRDEPITGEKDEPEHEIADGMEGEATSPKPIDISKLEEAIINIAKPMAKNSQLVDLVDTEDNRIAQGSTSGGSVLPHRRTFVSKPSSFGMQRPSSTAANFQQPAALGYYPAVYYPPPVPFAPSYPFHPYYSGYFQAPGAAGGAAFHSMFRGGHRSSKVANFNGREQRQFDFNRQLDPTIFQYGPKMRNVTCIMQELGYLDENLNPNYMKMNERINKLSIEEELKRDMLEGIKFCREFSQCVPDTKKDSFQLSRELLRPMFFFRCYKHKKLESCIMKDMRDKFSESKAEFNNHVHRSFRSNDVTSKLFDFLFDLNGEDSDFLL